MLSFRKALHRLLSTKKEEYKPLLGPSVPSKNYTQVKEDKVNDGDKRYLLTFYNTKILALADKGKNRTPTEQKEMEDCIDKANKLYRKKV